MSIPYKITSGIYPIIRNEQLAPNIYLMSIKGEFNVKPGQFINIKIADCFLRRPISIANVDTNSLDIIYKVVGEGTKKMSQLKSGASLDVLIGLGNGFSLVKNKKVLLIGGGIGTPPLLELKKRLEKANQVQLLVGLNNKLENIYDEYDPIYTTIDGSLGYQGDVVDFLTNNELDYDYVYICGPIPMIKALEKYLKVPGQISIEARMGCGFGACMGCSCKTKNNESRRICVEGPVFKLGELNFDEY